MPRTLTEQEFNTVRQSVLQAAPPNMDEGTFQKWIGPQMSAALAEAETRPAAPDGSGLARGAAELYHKSPVAPVVAAVGGVANTVAHPLDTYFGLKPVAETIKGLAMAQWDQAVQAAQKAKEAAHGGGALSASEAFGHGLAAVLPILGPAAADVGEHGARGDVGGMVGGAMGLLAPFAAKYALELKNAPNPGKADLLRRDAEQTVSQRVLAPGNPKYKGNADALAPEVLKRGLQGTRLELQQVADEGMAKAADQIDQAIDARAKSSGGLNYLPTKPIVDALNKRIDDFTVKGKPIPTAVGRIENLTKLRDHIDGLGATLSFEQLRKLRDEFYTAADAAKGYTQNPDQSVADLGFAAREAGSAIRQSIGKDNPSLLQPNADYTFFKRLGDVLDPTLGRPKNVSYAPTGVTGGLSTAGAIMGQAMSNIPIVKGAAALLVSRILPALKEAQNSPSWQLASAARKMEIADAIEAGQIGKAQGLLLMIAQGAPRNLTAKDSMR